MEFVRQIINSNDLEPILTLPVSFHDVQVEVIVRPVSPSRPDILKKAVKHSAYGRLKAYANPSLISEESGAWGKAAVEKHAVP